jgi:signal transduction histidine kinase
MPALATASKVVIEPKPAAGVPCALEQLSMDDLRDLMESVTQTTQRLQTTHVALHDQVARLQRELTEANAALRRSQALAALGEMAAGIAHEVRNPLASIQLYAQMLGEDLTDRPPQAELCGRINRAVVTLDAIVRDVLSFARETRLDVQPTTSFDLFDAALHSCAALIAGHKVMVMLEEEPRLSLHADFGLMTQALSNIMRNAIEAMLEHSSCDGERTHLRLWAQRRRWRDESGRSQTRIALCVQDSGPGISDDVRDRIFNPFFTTRTTGTGLGLAIVHRIIDAHGGHIQIDNVKPHGARIELCLPGKRADSANLQRSITHH